MRNELSIYLSSQSTYDEIRIAILGIGNELRGDDAAGVLVARQLAAWIKKRAERHPADGTVSTQQATKQGRLVIYDTGPSPESFAGPLRRFRPDIVILVDAAELGEPPGTVRVFNWDTAEGMSASTHGMPPTLMAKYLVAELGCEVALVGIQPGHLEFDSPISDEVRLAVRKVNANFRKVIARHF